MNDTPTPSDDTRDGTDSQVTEWLGQNVDSDAELADELVEEHGEEEAAEMFDEQARGADVEQRRRGDSIDPDLGRAAYREPDPGHAADADTDSGER